MAPLIEIYRDDFHTLLANPRSPIVRLIRSSRPYPEIRDFEHSFIRVIEALDKLGREGRVILADVREAPGRNDPEYEEAALRLRPTLYRGFRRVGVLVQTQLGALHLKRIAQEDGVERFVSTNEAEIVEYLRSAQQSEPPISGGPRTRR